MKVRVEDIDVGFELPSLSKVMVLEGMNAGKIIIPGTVEANPIHSDPEASKREGLKAPIATGMTSTFWLNQMLTDFFGEDWLRGGTLADRYIAPIYLGDQVMCKGIVTGKAREGRVHRLTLDVWCEKADGQKATVGTCTLVVR